MSGMSFEDGRIRGFVPAFCRAAGNCMSIQYIPALPEEDRDYLLTAWENCTSLWQGILFGGTVVGKRDAQEDRAAGHPEYWSGRWNLFPRFLDSYRLNGPSAAQLSVMPPRHPDAEGSVCFSRGLYSAWSAVRREFFRGMGSI